MKGILWDKYPDIMKAHRDKCITTKQGIPIHNKFDNIIKRNNMEKILKYRYILTVDNNIRILTIGILKNKYNDVINNNGSFTSDGYVEPIHTKGWSIDINNQLVISTTMQYSFAYSILASEDDGNFNTKKEDLILTGRLNSTKYCKSNFELPIELDSKSVTKSLADRYARHIVNTVVNKFADIRGRKINGKRLPNKKVIISEYTLD